MTHIGFTGTRKGWTTFQHERVLFYLRKWQDRGAVFHHGDCIGADVLAAEYAHILGLKVVCHPPTSKLYRAFAYADECRPEKPYLVRNRDIVNESFFMIATPKSLREELRSGTWAAIRYARKKNRLIYCIGGDAETILK